MNEGYRYTQDNFVDQDHELIDASRADIVKALSHASLSVMELVAFSQYPYYVTNEALHQLETQGTIRKTFELTDQQNSIVGYELAD
ncbi:MAG: hypothetical protein H6797_00720 [Candidatus Nomurabacteria bacterium]|nr:MAG: hypothetical protein H6797_00720 [Candidatus Nomurabacteria bacterium]